MLEYRPQALLRVTGEDAFSFLQGQFTNELRQPPGSVTYGLWLNQKGKVIADSQVLRVSENEFLIFSAHSSAAVIRQRLEDYIVADEVTLADETVGVRGLLIWGAGSGEVVGRLFGGRPAASRLVRREDVFVFGGQRLSGENYEILGPEKTLLELRGQLEARAVEEASAAEMEFARITAGRPLVPVDIGAGDLPGEGGLDEPAISYTKGCYLGQEVMARLKNLGQVRRRLQVVRGRGPAPSSLALVYQGEKKVGELRSVAGRDGGFVALAMLSLINLNAAAGLSLTPGGAPDLSLDHHG